MAELWTHGSGRLLGLELWLYGDCGCVSEIEYF
jgi:hypothetical protein